MLCPQLIPRSFLRLDAFSNASEALNERGSSLVVSLFQGMDAKATSRMNKEIANSILRERCGPRTARRKARTAMPATYTAFVPFRACTVGAKPDMNERGSSWRYNAV